jgi:hypothetical protein
VKAESSKEKDQSKTRSKEAADLQDSVLMSVFSIKPMLSSLPFSRASSAALSHSAMESRWLTDVIQHNSVRMSLYYYSCLEELGKPLIRERKDGIS